MWVLHLIPDSLLEWVINGLILVGILGTIVSWIASLAPFLSPYKNILSFVSTVLLVIGVFFRGGYAVEADWRARLDEMETKLRAAEEKANNINTETETKVVEKVKHLKEIVYVNKTIIQEKKASILEFRGVIE